MEEEQVEIETDVVEETVSDTSNGAPQSNESVYAMQINVINSFRRFFEVDGQPHFDVALRNMEIARLSAEVESRDKLIASLQNGK